MFCVDSNLQVIFTVYQSLLVREILSIYRSEIEDVSKYRQRRRALHPELGKESTAAVRAPEWLQDYNGCNTSFICVINGWIFSWESISFLQLYGPLSTSFAY